MSAIAARKARLAAAAAAAASASTSVAPSPEPSARSSSSSSSTPTPAVPSTPEPQSKSAKSSKSKAKSASARRLPETPASASRKKPRRSPPDAASSSRPASSRYFAAEDLPRPDDSGKRTTEELAVDSSDSESGDSDAASSSSSSSSGSSSSRLRSPKRGTNGGTPRRPAKGSHGTLDWLSPLWVQGPRSRSEVSAAQQDSGANAVVLDVQGPRKGKRVILGLQSGQTMSFYGIASLTVLHGAADVNGMRISDSMGPQSLFCPQTSFLPLITARKPQRPALSPFADQATIPPPTSASTPSDLLVQSGLSPEHFDCILAFSTIQYTGLQQLPLVCPLAGPDPFAASASSSAPAVLPSLPGSEVNLPFFRSVFASRARSGAYAFHSLPESWTDTLDTLRSGLWPSMPVSMPGRGRPSPEPQSFLVRGSKGAGKSTFARTLLNTLRFSASARGDTQDGDEHDAAAAPRSVAFMDLDLGQAEFGVPGTVSLYIFSAAADDDDATGAHHGVPLLSPSWLTHAASPQPVLSHYLGQTTPRDVPSLYLSAVQSLADRFAAELSARRGALALVVNTMGWTKGLGAELAARVEAILRPHVIFDLVPTVERAGSGASSSAISLPLPEPFTAGPYTDAHGAPTAPGPTIVSLQAVGMDLKALAALRDVDTDAFPLGDAATSAKTTKLLPAADQRTLSIMTHMHSRSGAAGSSDLRWSFVKPLLEQRPLVVDVARGLKGGIRFVPTMGGGGGGGRAPDPHLALSALNGELVGLACLLPEGESETDSDAAYPQDVATGGPGGASGDADPWVRALTLGSSSPPTAQQHPLRMHFLSLAIIRSIDFKRGELHILCPPSALVSPTAETEAPLTRPLMRPLTLPLTLLKASGDAGSTSGSVELPIWASLDFACLADARVGRLGVLSGDGDGDASGGRKLAGVRLKEVPYLDWPVLARGQGQGQVQGVQEEDGDAEEDPLSGTALEPEVEVEMGMVGRERRRVRRNLMRKNQG